MIQLYVTGFKKNTECFADMSSATKGTSRQATWAELHIEHGMWAYQTVHNKKMLETKLTIFHV